MLKPFQYSGNMQHTFKLHIAQVASVIRVHQKGREKAWAYILFLIFSFLNNNLLMHSLFNLVRSVANIENDF